MVSIMSIFLMLFYFSSLFIYICFSTESVESSINQPNRVSNNPKLYTIGALLTSSQNKALFLQVIEDINFEPNILPIGVTINGVSESLDSNPVRNIQTICGKLFPRQMYALIMDDAESVANSVLYTMSLHHIPTIGISNRQSLLSDKNSYPTYMRAVTPHYHQVDVWIEIINHLGFNCVILIHGDDFEGRSAHRRFLNLAQENNIKIEFTIDFEAGFADIISQLEEAREMFTCRVFALYANEEDSQNIYEQIVMLNMTSAGFVWIVAEDGLFTNKKPNGILGAKLANAEDKEGLIRDSAYIIGMALRDWFHTENVTKPPMDCSNLNHNKWASGVTFTSYLKKNSLIYGKTGSVSFDEKGDRINSDYLIINVIDGENFHVGNYSYTPRTHKMSLLLNESNIIWPGSEMQKPLGYEVKTHLRVATLAEKPFIWINQVDDYDQCGSHQIACPKFNSTSEEERKYCCEGYCIDLLRTLASNLNFTYSLHQVEDGLYGAYSFINESKRKVWTGLVGELVYDKADMVIAPLTINRERTLAIEFTKPFKYQGITILERKQDKNSTLTSFLQPFQNDLWVMVAISVHIVGLSLYLLDRFSPFGRYKLPVNLDTTEEDALNLSSAIWFSWGVLLNSGIGEGTPRSFSGRVLGMVWAGFAMIVVASYTANLAAFLVLDRPVTTLSGINDARLRNPSKDFSYATVRESAVDMYFRRQVELSNMYASMKDRNYQNVDDAIYAVKSGEINALLGDSARLEYEAAQDCELRISGEPFGRSGYAIGLQKGSYWAEKVTLALLSFHESGYMEDLDNKWILLDEQACEEFSELKSATLGFHYMAGVFIVLGLAIVVGVGLISFEIMYKKSSTKKQRNLELARNAIDKWKEMVEKKKTMLANHQAARHYRAKAQFQQRAQYSLPSFSAAHQQQEDLKNSSKTTPSQLEIISTPFTVQKGLNEIITEKPSKFIKHQYSPAPKRRPVLTRASEIETIEPDYDRAQSSSHEQHSSATRMPHSYY